MLFAENARGVKYHEHFLKGVLTMCENSDIIEQRVKHYEQIQKATLMQDIYASKFFKGRTKEIQVVLRIILEKDDLIVLKCNTQEEAKNIFGKTGRFDILAQDSKHKYYNIEIQQKNDGAKPKRARYYSSEIDENLLQTGEDYDKLVETYVIFITKQDVFADNLPIYHFDRRAAETQKLLEDGAHIIYVNGAIEDDTPLGRLMQDFHANKPERMHYKELAERARYLKVEKEGTAEMSEEYEELIDKGRKEGEQKERESGIKTLLETMRELNATPDVILAKLMEKYHLTQEQAEGYLAEN